MRKFFINSKRGGITTLDDGDMVEWSVLNLHINDYQDIFKRIQSGDLLQNIPVTTFSTCDKHSGFVIKILEDYIVVMDLVGRKEVTFHRTDILNTLVVLNKSGEKKQD